MLLAYFTYLTLSDQILPSLHRRQEQNRLLYLRSEQQQQIHDLSHPRSADVGHAGEVGLVVDGAVAD